MSKRDLKKYIAQISKEQLEEQFIELYDKFKEVKVYYDFVFNPKEDKLVQEAKIKVSNEYFPVKGRKAKLRRSTSQKFIKHFITLGVDSFLVADLMLYSIEIAQAHTSEKIIRQEMFFKGLLNSFSLAISYMIENNILYEFKERVVHIKDNTIKQKWNNKDEFIAIIERFEY